MLTAPGADQAWRRLALEAERVAATRGAGPIMSLYVLTELAFEAGTDGAGEAVGVFRDLVSLARVHRRMGLMCRAQQADALADLAQAVLAALGPAPTPPAPPTWRRRCWPRWARRRRRPPPLSRPTNARRPNPGRTSSNEAASLAPRRGRRAERRADRPRLRRGGEGNRRPGAVESRRRTGGGGGSPG